MPGIIIPPHPELATMTIQGIFTVHREDADLECNCPQRRGGGCGGIEIASIPLVYRKFELLCASNAKQFLSSMGKRGREWAGTPILLHGPWPSRVVNLQDADAPQWRDIGKREADGFEHPEHAAAVVQTLTAPAYTHMDYILVADFTVRDYYTDLES